MYIINTFVKGFKRLFAARGAVSASPVETIPLFSSSSSLTGNFEDFGHSKEAFTRCVIHLVIYLIAAILGYSYVFENWPIVDSVYFAVTVFTTVGYGDMSPTNDYARLFTCAFAIYGIVILGIFLGIAGGLIMEARMKSVEERKGKARKKVIDSFKPEPVAEEPKSVVTDIWKSFVLEIPIVLILAVVASPIIYTEGWDVVMGIYWMTITGTTIGFGDFSPTNSMTRLICIFYLPLSVAVLGEFIGRVAGTIVDHFDDIQEDRFLNRTMTLMDLKVMDANKDGKVSEAEFLTYLLVALQKVEREDIDEIMEIFRRIDKDKSGFIDREDLVVASSKMMGPTNNS